MATNQIQQFGLTSYGFLEYYSMNITVFECFLFFFSKI